MCGQPELEMRQRKLIEPFPVHRRELPHKRHDRCIRQTAYRTAELTGICEASVNVMQERLTALAMQMGVTAMTLGIFVPVEMMLEVTIVSGNQLRIIALQPAFGVASLQSPAHDVKALVDHLTGRQDKHGNGALGRGGQHGLRFCRDPDFAQHAACAADRQCQPRSHCIRAAAEAVEDGINCRVHLLA